MGTENTHDSNRQIAKSSGIIGLATLCSRLLGFIRDIVIARLFGVYVYAQAFVIAFRIPNLFRDLVAEGAANSAFVPVFSEYKVKHSKEDFWELANVVLNLLLVVLAGITVLGITFSPAIVRIIAPGFIAEPDKLEATIRLNRLIFPYILLVGLSAYSAAILNSLRHFSVPAFSPCILNISIIVFALIFGENIKGLALGVLIGGLLQLAIQIPVLYKKGFRLRFPKHFKHPAAFEIGHLMLPRLGSSAIYQLNTFIDSVYGSLSSIVGEGGVAGLYFGYRLIQFPIGIFSNSLAQVILPTFSTQALEEGLLNLKKTLSWGLRTVFFIMIPASAGFMVLSQQIVFTLFQGGKFDAYATGLTASALFYYSIGLFAYAGIKIIQCCYFALKDTVTPAKVSILTLALNIIFNTIFMFPLKLAGLALATSLSGIISFLVLGIMLRKKLGGFGLKEVVFSFTKILLASIAMSMALFYCSRYSSFDGAMPLKLLKISGIVLIGAVFYLIFCFLFRVKEARDFFRWVFELKNRHG
ncbi:MAG: murein biosynthesis integral membrane protein MurJ [Candidatus Omnitrophota bacterium]|jgi:putative peptidoglycan lipid II flippase|nr:MAG: murein biosynthesis integral membrane protein MurJ [Candidatus Omnitrophota bacterium]